MTSSQLARRARLVETVIDLIAEVGSEAVQMRDVAQRSGVALATVYRYFSSKEHLLAAALEDWQKRLTRRVLANTPPGQDPLPGILDYLRRALRAFQRNPAMTALMLQMTTSAVPEVRAAVDRMARTNAEMFDSLLKDLPPQDVPSVSFGLNAALTSALTAMLHSDLSLDESQRRVEWVARALLAHATERTPG
ncbi:TetR family transcriptional regulator [Mycobacterium sp. Y57]|nr:TetR family transcriptional regulator [Mycolicibacterium xanthum]